MNIVADENIDLQIVERLRADGHDVIYVAELNPGIDDDTVLGHSHQRAAVLLTSDKDFGDLVFRRRLLHSGVLLLRLEGLMPEKKANMVAAMESHGAELARKIRGTHGENSAGPGIETSFRREGAAWTDRRAIICQTFESVTLSGLRDTQVYIQY